MRQSRSCDELPDGQYQIEQDEHGEKRLDNGALLSPDPPSPLLGGPRRALGPKATA